ncbi:MAG: transcription termination/antitermination protein NusG, partial [Planctomycetota bacterium]|nr:transcription termination/antitermination protein NusG [Planctomycetota bacterium]
MTELNNEERPAETTSNAFEGDSGAASSTPEDAVSDTSPESTPADGDAAEVEAPAAKRLLSGRAAAAKLAVNLSPVGVATTRLTESPTRRKTEVEEVVDEDDLPMYREGMDWFVLRVASNKESSVRETLLRKVAIEGMPDLVGRIMVPTEKIKTFKAGKQKVTETKLYPGYVFVEMRLEPDGRIPQDVFFLIKETTGVGDFVGTAGRPTPMAPHEVQKMLFDSKKPDETPEVRFEFTKGDPVTIKEGPFENYEGTVDEVLKDK